MIEKDAEKNAPPKKKPRDWPKEQDEQQICSETELPPRPKAAVDGIHVIH
jgi:hypothetical protein